MYGCMMVGPPGTGKTMLAKAIATESDTMFLSLSCLSLLPKSHGRLEEVVQLIQSVFERVLLLLCIRT